MQGFPIQRAKVQRPPLRAATLHRQRLIKWLDDHISRRVIFVTAEAGYGKTTLLADWARRARVRLAWYRIDEEDANWVSFVHYLVAAGRELDPGFAARTSELLTARPGEISREDVVAALSADLQELVRRGPVLLIVDDYHLVDHVSEIRALMKTVIRRAPNGLSFIVAGRRPCNLEVSRLRSMGDVAELRSSDLRFDLAETEQLFHATYGRELATDVIEDVNRRTEGWAASLQLVEAALRDRSPDETRAFVRTLTGAKGDLYDYLAEEVVADLDPDVQTFLMRTSILQVVDREMAAVVTGFADDAIDRLIAATERLGLLGRRGQHEPEGHRYHPLVREFLEARLRAEEGDAEAVGLHRRVALANETVNWRASAHHYGVIGDSGDLHRLLITNAPLIMATGEFDIAKSYADRLDFGVQEPAFDLFLSRMELDRGDAAAALVRAESAFFALTNANHSLRHLALSNLASVNLIVGNLEQAYGFSRDLAASDASIELREIGRVMMATLEVSTTGRLDEYQNDLMTMAARHRRDGKTHYLAITLLNAGMVAQPRGDSKTAEQTSSEAIVLLRSGSRRGELMAAQINHAWSLAHDGHWDKASSEVLAGLKSAEGIARSEGLVEAADLWTWYADQDGAERLMNQARSAVPGSRLADEALPLTEIDLHCRAGRLTEARAMFDGLPPQRVSTEVAHEARRRYLGARLAVLEGTETARQHAIEAREFALRQHAEFYARCLEIVVAATHSPAHFDAILHSVGEREPVYLTLVSDIVGRRLHDLSQESLALVTREALSRPLRWRDTARSLIDRQQPSAVRAASLLDQIGASVDVPLLRRAARTLRGRGVSTRLGRDLARRLAQRVFVEDQGRLQLRVGEALVPDDDVRRKVLSVVCFLLTRAALSATRDEVLDAVWPDVDPDSAVNSLNQTLYFLRRVLEPHYKEELSANYVHHDSDVIWLDESLIDSRSRRCRRLIEEIAAGGSGGDVETLARDYRGKFALDFAYEEWATSYRETLHASYLEAIEKAIVDKINLGQPAHAIALARRALQIDPEADQLERLLMRGYHDAGSHAAVGEQYAHYAAYLKNELGIEPPDLEDLISDGFGL